MIPDQTVDDVVLEAGDADAVPGRDRLEEVARRLAEAADDAHAPAGHALTIVISLTLEFSS